MNSKNSAPYLLELAGSYPAQDHRILCLAPPGELFELSARCLEAVGASGRVTVMLPGDPFLHASLPPEVEIIEGRPEKPEKLEGPFDLVLAWGSYPFINDLDEFLGLLVKLLRPGARLCLDLPAYGFCPVLQASHPAASTWLLPRLVDMEEACFELELRDICGMTWVELRKYDSLPDMLEDLIKPYPLQFEGRRGEALLDELRKNLSSAFRGTEDLSLALRRTRLRALR